MKYFVVVELQSMFFLELIAVWLMTFAQYFILLITQCPENTDRTYVEICL